jgi:hypothetical protein
MGVHGMTAASAARFSVGGVLGQGFEVFVKNLVPFGIISLVVTFPSFVYQLINGASAVTTDATMGNGTVYVGRSVAGGGAFLAILIELALRQVAIGAISYGVFQEMRGQRADLADCLRRAGALVLVVLGVAVVAAIATILATFLLVVPGLIVATMLWVAVPVAVVERPGVMQSLSRSAALTKGSRWQVFGIVLLIGIGAFVASYVVARIFGAGTLGSFISWIVAAAISAFAASATAVGYTTLRFAKEGVGIDQIAAVFD